MGAMENEGATVTVELESAVGPRVLVRGEIDEEQVEAALPAGWTVGQNWHNGVKLLSGEWSYPLVAVGAPAHDAQNGTDEHEGGSCPTCGAKAELRICDDCNEEAWIIDCGHYAQPRPIAAGRSDGSEMHRTYCEDCAAV